MTVCRHLSGAAGGIRSCKPPVALALWGGLIEKQEKLYAE
jgi:hypothetical protein